MAYSPSDAGPHHHLPAPDSYSELSSIVCDMSQQVQTVMENMLKMINHSSRVHLLRISTPFQSEIDHSSSGIVEDIEKCKFSALERKKNLEDQKEMVQNAAFAVVEMLNKRT